jgi:hypothetical protein
MHSARQAGRAFISSCRLLYSRGQEEEDRLCMPDRSGFHRRILQECCVTLLGIHFGWHKMAALVQRLAYWQGKTCYVEDHISTWSASAPKQST